MMNGFTVRSRLRKNSTSKPSLSGGQIDCRSRRAYRGEPTAEAVSSERDDTSEEDESSIGEGATEEDGSSEGDGASEDGFATRRVRV